MRYENAVTRKNMPISCTVDLLPDLYIDLHFSAREDLRVYKVWVERIFCSRTMAYCKRFLCKCSG